MTERSPNTPLSWRLVAATLAAPLLGAAGAAMTALPAICGEEISCAPISFGFAALFGAWFGLFIGLPAMVLLGLPIHALLVKRRTTSVFAYAGAGAVVGAAVSLAYFTLQATAFWVALGAGAGALASAIFWLIRRPDRVTANPHTSLP